MEDKTVILKCFNHSHFVKALAAPELFEFKNPNENNNDLFYEEIYMECRATLDDLSLIEGKPFMLYGQFVTKEQKKGCVLDLMDFISDSATSISLIGGYEALVVKEKDTIIITSHFNAFKTKLGANRDKTTKHDPMISFEKIENNSNSYVGGTVEDTFKFSFGRVVHSSNITDEVDMFDIYENGNELPRFIRKIDEVYPKGLLIRKSKIYSIEELIFLEEEKEKKIQRKLHIKEVKEQNLREDLEIQRQKKELKKVRKEAKNNKGHKKLKRG